MLVIIILLCFNKKLYIIEFEHGNVLFHCLDTAYKLLYIIHIFILPFQ